ncbi:hypothetical protein BIV57_22665 [Mangrovactinospora gilvigrisea]|uniref:histidine kinase n=1 Tax=Mangrovactinospora gilvigrisea TaxID=1428644 RepID=A0A1J7B9F9_9ACTN|nr:histidine kinase [Mangrovactinospora gilvigrisea]OIV35237.1 hypothetical protein BIV57_22665 [Mangrovactinospora gilvigrisea]
MAREGGDLSWRQTKLAIRLAALAALTVYSITELHGEPALRLRQAAVAALMLAALPALRLIRARARRHDLRWCVGAMVALALIPAGLALLGAETAAVVVAIVTLIAGVQWMPAAIPAAAVVLTVPVILYGFRDPGWWGSLLALGAALSGGYGSRANWEARGEIQRRLTEERALRAAVQDAAEANARTAALDERARLAREIHDVLAHSLSAQVVHLEAARLMLERGDGSAANRAEVLQRVVDARAMARNGLEETRGALRALRGENAPAADELAALARADGALIDVRGPARPLSAEAGQALRRTAQEALTNVRKHAPGAKAHLTLDYLPDAVELEVTNPRSAPDGRGERELAASGSGYGLLGMRERAELLGGEFRAGPTEEGFRVWVRLPTETA